MQDLMKLTKGEVSYNELNPRKDTGDVNGLMESIIHNGLLQPLLVRPNPNGFCYELIAGERRLTAINKAVTDGLLPENYEFPVQVVDADDQTVIRMMLVENLQRENLSEYDQAVSFSEYVEKGGEDEKKAIDLLSEKTGMTQHYIRRRVKVMSLPSDVLDLWRSGKICYSHLEQLLRVKPEDASFLAQKTVEKEWSVGQIRSVINSQKTVLADALFDRKAAGCTKCGYSTQVQKSLFGGDDMKADKVKCTNPACFAANQQKHLRATWDESEDKKKYGTNGPHFSEEPYAVKSFYYGGDMPEACLSCLSYVTVYDMTGEVCRNQACADQGDCHQTTYLNTRPKTDSQGNAKPTTPEEKAEAKSERLGAEFSEIFFKEELEEKMSTLSTDDVSSLRVALLGMAKTNSGIVGKILDELNPPKKVTDVVSWAESNNRFNEFYQSILEMESLEILGWLGKIGREIVMDPRNFDFKMRDAVCRQFDIVLERDFVMEESFLKKKTKAELMAMNEQFKVFDMSHDSMDKLKKTELIAHFQDHDLSGMIPDDILDMVKLNIE